MGKKTLILGLIITFDFCITFVVCDYYSQTLPFTPKQEVVTNLHFFYRDTLTGSNPTAVLIANSNLTKNDHTSPTPFGSLLVNDDPLTTGPDPKSDQLGNARGMYVSSGKVQPTVTMYVDFGFTSGEFNGSSISVFSRNQVLDKEREVAVVGGRGRFRMGRGVANLRTFSVDLTTGDAVVECNVTVYHY